MDSFKEGYEYIKKNLIIDKSEKSINSNNEIEYINNVNKTINDARKNLVEISERYKNNKSESAMGFVFESYHTGSYNVNRAKNNPDSMNIAYNIPPDGIYHGPDIVSNDYSTGNLRQTSYQAKVYKNAGRTAKALRGYGSETKRLVTSDQIENAKQISIERSNKYKFSRPDVAAEYNNVSENLVDKVEDSNGISSNPIEKNKVEELTNDLRKKKGKTNLKKYGISNGEQYMIMVKESLKAGITAAELSLLFNAAPKLINFIIYSIRKEELDLDKIQGLGIDCAKDTTKSFIYGGVAAFATYLCKTGKFGEKLKNADATLVGTITVLLLDMIGNGIKVAINKMSKKEYINNLIKESYIMMISYGTIKLFEHIPYINEIPMLANIIGGLVGGAIGMYTYNLIGRKVISFVVEEGITMFGLFEQDYTLPDSVLKKLGVDLFEFEKIEFEEFKINEFNFEQFEYENFDYEEIEMVYLRRGVIGINKIGYIE